MDIDIDLLVNDSVVVELKAIESVLRRSIAAQVLSYLRFGRFKLGYLLNFNRTRVCVTASFGSSTVSETWFARVARDLFSATAREILRVLCAFSFALL